MPRKGKSSKPTACEHCSGQKLRRRITTYRVPVDEPGFSNFPELKGNQIYIGRVALHECETCGHLMPMSAGRAKIERNVALDILLFTGRLLLTLGLLPSLRIPAESSQTSGDQVG
jgi:hypothetical protein